jgi:hypothetical protein
MKFPEYVPPAARKFFSLEIQALERLVEVTEPTVSNLERLLPRVVGLQRSLLLSMHNQSRKEYHHLSDRLRIIRRLAGLDSYDVMMEAAYVGLTKEFCKDGQWLRYVAAAYWSSARNYSAYRESKREIEALYNQLAEGMRVASAPYITHCLHDHDRSLRVVSRAHTRRQRSRFLWPPAEDLRA